MKKFFIISLIPIFVFLLPLGLIGGSFFLTGCSEESPSNFDIDQIPPYSENIFSLSRYPYFNEFFGTPTSNDFMGLIRTWSETMLVLKNQDFLAQVPEESSITGLLMWVRDGFIESQEEYDAAKLNGEEHPLVRRSDALITNSEIMIYTGVGEVLNEVFAQLGQDWITLHLYPIMEHWFTMDEDMYRNDFLGNIQEMTDSLGKISEDDFETLIDILERMLDDDDETYGIIWDAIPSAWDIIDFLRTVDDVDVGDLTANIDSIIDYIRDAVSEDISPDAEDILTEVGDAVKRVWDNENNDGEIVLKEELDADGDLVPLAPADYVTLTFKGELRKLLHSVGLMMNREITEAPAYNTWDTYAMTDLSRVLFSAEDFLDDSILPRATLRSYLEGILAEATKFDGADSLNGILGTYYNPVYFSGFDYGLDYAFKHNMNNELRTSVGVDQTSALRTVLYLLEGFDADNFGLLIGAFLGSPDGMVNRFNMLDFAFGEAATANATSGGYDDAFEILDYVLYEKDYSICIPTLFPPLELCSPPFNGFFGMLEAFNFVLGIKEIDDLIAALTSGMDFAVMPSAYILLGIDKTNQPGETGYIHQMFFFPRVIEHFYFQPYPGRAEPDGWKGFRYGWEHEVVDFAVSLNEIPSLSGYDFATDPGASVMKALEGPYGYGLATYALRDHSSDGSDDGLLDPVLYMLSMVVDELINTSDDNLNNTYTYYNGTKYEGTLWTALMDHIKDHKLLGLDVDEDYDEWIPYVFDPDDEGDELLDTVRDLLVEFHGDIDNFARNNLGQALVKLIRDNDGASYDQIEADIDAIMDILELVTADVDLTGSEGFKDIILYLLEENEDGSDNQFIANIKAIFIKLLDLPVDRATGDDGKDDIEKIHGLEKPADESPTDYQARKEYYKTLYTRKDGGHAYWLEGTEIEGVSKEYNTSLPDIINDDGTIGDIDDTTLGDLVRHLFGEDENLNGGLYSACNVKDYVDEMFDDSFMTSFWFEWVIEEPLNMTIVQHAPDFSYNNKGFALASFLGFLFFDGPDEPLQMPYLYIKELFFCKTIDIDGNKIPEKANFYNLFRIMRFETNFTGLMEDYVLYFGGEDMRPGGEAWEVWKGILSYYSEGESIW